MHSIPMEKYFRVIERANPVRQNGRVSEVVGLVIEGDGPGISVGELCEIYPKNRTNPLLAEVVGFKGNKMLLMPIGEVRGLSPGARIVATERRSRVKVGDALLGRVIDGLGEPIDGKGFINTTEEYPLYSPPLNPLSRDRVKEPLDLGVKAINGLLTCGKGQRLGIFAGSGVGKSTLLGMMARYTNAEINVIGLIGERGREVKDFIERDLRESGLKRSVLVIATSDQPPLVRMRAAFMATVIAEYFRNQGKDVLLMMDSVTRFAMAQREVGLAVGEPPATKGYPPSVFALLPRLLERGGNLTGKGSISALYTILVEGNDLTEPIADAVMSILDGHVVLSREMAAQNHYPAIDVLNSVSRTMIDTVSPKLFKESRKLVEIMATYKRAEDLINIGAYKTGSSPEIDYAISMINKVNSYLKQEINEKVDFLESQKRLLAIFN